MLNAILHGLGVICHNAAHLFLHKLLHSAVAPWSVHITDAVGHSQLCSFILLYEAWCGVRFGSWLGQQLPKHADENPTVLVRHAACKRERSKSNPISLSCEAQSMLAPAKEPQAAKEPSCNSSWC